MKTNWKLVLIATTTLLVTMNIDKVKPKYNVESNNEVSIEVQTDKISSNESTEEVTNKATEKDDEVSSTKSCNDYVFVNNNTDIKETEDEIGRASCRERV